MEDFTLWFTDADDDLATQGNPPIDLPRLTVSAAILAAKCAWMDQAATTGPAHLHLYENLSGRLVFELSPGPSC
jgi:hypothetical protein